MTKPKLHHQLPQSYMRRFSFDGQRVHVFDRITGKYRPDGVRNVAAETEFYSLTTADGEKERWPETRLAQIDEAVRVFDKLEQREEITRKERWGAAFFSGFAESRTAGFRQEQRNAATQDEDEIDEALKRRFEEAQCAASGVWLDFRTIENIAREQLAHISDGLDDLTALAAGGMHLAMHLFWTHWAVSFAPKGSAFLTSDRPLALLRPKQGFADDPFDPDVLRVLPLSPCSALVMGIPANEPTLQFSEVGSGFVRLVNASVARRAHRSIIAHDDALLRGAAGDARITGANNG